MRVPFSRKIAGMPGDDPVGWSVRKESYARPPTTGRNAPLTLHVMHARLCRGNNPPVTLNTPTNPHQASGPISYRGIFTYQLVLPLLKFESFIRQFDRSGIGLGRPAQFNSHSVNGLDCDYRPLFEPMVVITPDPLYFHVLYVVRTPIERARPRSGSSS